MVIQDFFVVHYPQVYAESTHVTLLHDTLSTGAPQDVVISWSLPRMFAIGVTAR